MKKQPKLQLHDKSYRFQLKSEILKKGFRTQTDFCNDSSIDQGIMSRILNGWMIPDSKTQQRLMSTLDIDKAKLFRLLK